MNVQVLVLVLYMQIDYGSAVGYITEQGKVHISQQDQAVAVDQERERCYRHILLDPYPKGVYCNRTFDGIYCWPDTQPGVTQYQPCPNYVQGFYIGDNATRKCLADGTWFVSSVTNASWSNYTQCLRPTPNSSNIPQLFRVHVEYIQLMYTTGYGISLVSLTMAVFIMLKFKKLHCPRNTVHVNLFVSFIFRAILSFLKDILFVEGVGFSIDVEKTPNDNVEFKENGTHWQCKLLYTLFHYVVLASYMWILVEGLYLHTLVYVSVFSERGSVKWYYVIGWCTPLISVIPWVFVRIALENILCWNTNPTPGYSWIIKTPIVVSTVINFIFFINILRALFTKLHKANSTSARRNRYRRLAKATLILIPLFGVHFIVFLGMPDNVAPTAELVRLYFEMFFNSFQGFIVAILLCFLNQEVQMVLKKTWYRIWSKPDPLFLQQSQALADSQNHNNGSRRIHRDSKNGLKVDKPVSSEASTDQVQMVLKKTWYRIWSKPDPLFLQQSQALADSQNHNNGSRRIHRDSKNGLKVDKPVSSEASTDQANCLCKWSLFTTTLNVQMVLKKTWYRIWSKPDPLFLQQSQALADSQNHNNGSRRIHRDSKNGLKVDKPVSSEASTDQANCLCKWSLDQNGKLRPMLLRTCSEKSMKGTKHLLARETKL